MSVERLRRFFRLDVEGERLTLKGAAMGLWTITLLFGLGLIAIALATSVLGWMGGPAVWDLTWRFLAGTLVSAAFFIGHAAFTRERWRIEIDRKKPGMRAWRRGVEQPPEVLEGLEFAVGTPPGAGPTPHVFYLIAILKAGRQIRLVRARDPKVIKDLLTELIAWIEGRAAPVAPRAST